MVIDLVTTKTNDGYNSEVPSIRGCESWAHNEDDAIENALELVRFYLNLDSESEMIVDRAYRRGSSIIYKLVFEKDK